MGNVPGKKYKIILNQDDLQFLVNNTQFNQKEIEEWHARFTVSILKLLYKRDEVWPLYSFQMFL
jgi:hypothetical protein